MRTLKIFILGWGSCGLMQVTVVVLDMSGHNMPQLLLAVILYLTAGQLGTTEVHLKTNRVGVILVKAILFGGGNGSACTKLMCV